MAELRRRYGSVAAGVEAGAARHLPGFIRRRWSSHVRQHSAEKRGSQFTIVQLGKVSPYEPPLDLDSFTPFAHDPNDDAQAVLRQRHARPSPDDVLRWLRQRGATHAEREARGTLAEDVRRAVGELGSEDAELAWRVLAEREPISRVAKDLGLGRNVAKRRVDKISRRLRARLADYAPAKGRRLSPRRERPDGPAGYTRLVSRATRLAGRGPD
jgi:hypothetical protein